MIASSRRSRRCTQATIASNAASKANCNPGASERCPRSHNFSADSPVTAYAVKIAGGQLAPAGPLMDAAPWGWVVSKGSLMGPALQQALQRLIESGRYGGILDKWVVGIGAITKPEINAAVY